MVRTTYSISFVVAGVGPTTVQLGTHCKAAMNLYNHMRQDRDTYPKASLSKTTVYA